MHKNSVSTFALIGINLLIFGWLAFRLQSLSMNTTVDVLTILHSGANLNPLTLGGEPWRIITAMFLHFGIFHLLVNMYALFSMGRVLEPSLGTTRFLLIYFFCGVAAGLASLVFNLYTISAGASGALFGLYGYRLGAELIGSYHDRTKLNSVVINFIIFIVINAFLTTQFNVDLAGHIGGCIAGIGLSVLHFKSRLLIENRSLGVALLLLTLTLFAVPRDQLYYYRIFQRVISTEKHTNQLYSSNLTDFQIKDSLASVLPDWDAIHQALHGLRRVPSALISDTTRLGNYVRLRKLETSYRIALIEKESYVYLDSIEIVNGEFKNLPGFDHNLNFSIPEAMEEDKIAAQDSVAPLETRRVFYDAAWKETEDPTSASFYRIGTVDSSGRWQGQVHDFYRDGALQMKGKYTDNMKDGVFLYYSERNTYTSAGRYIKEDAVGKWENYHWNGALESEVFYDNGAFTMRVMDSLGRVQVRNGKGKVVSWHPNGQIAEEGNYIAGRREGDWYGFYENGAPYYHELFRDNRLVHGVSEDKEGKRYVYDQLSQYPFPLTGMKAYNEYLNGHLKKLPDPQYTPGTVKVIFNVGIDGSIWDFVIIKSLSPAQDREAVRLIKDGPAWRPGLMHGHVKLPSQGYVEVTF